ncbi:HD domain-containing protein [Paenibacillus spiritus]|uniref:HD domain-containing protein n=1 Tax=Paenibacillus spiritus TaxID=2496557 RepID=A0A5J5G965_9BACL|nr:HD domain-containing protein [Paenibacillus spiritus]KAA9004003.1 HD domain-containing protein [Paenibacillus spiritus]
MKENSKAGISETVLSEAEAFVRQRLLNEGTGHDWWHIYRVVRLADKLAEREGAETGIVRLAALFHDLADDKVVASKEQGMAEIAAWLEDHGVGERDWERILEIIATLSFRGGGGAPMTTLEGQVVQDADRLDAIGAVGIARTFSYNGSKGNLIYDPGLPVRETMTEAQYRQERGTAVNHFYEKLLKLKDRMNTAYGRELAEKRHRVMEQYLEQFFREWEGEDLQEL